MIYNENDRIIHKDGTELIVINVVTLSPYRENKNYDKVLIYKCFSTLTQNIVNIPENDIRGFKTPKED